MVAFGSPAASHAPSPKLSKSNVPPVSPLINISVTDNTVINIGKSGSDVKKKYVRAKNTTKKNKNPAKTGHHAIDRKIQKPMVSDSGMKFHIS